MLEMQYATPAKAHGSGPRPQEQQGLIKLDPV